MSSLRVDAVDINDIETLGLRVITHRLDVAEHIIQARSTDVVSEAGTHGSPLHELLDVLENAFILEADVLLHAFGGDIVFQLRLRIHQLFFDITYFVDAILVAVRL